MVAIDYFTKWIEVDPLASITSNALAKFFWKQIVCRYGVPRVVISDNGRQFQSQFAELCKSIGTVQRFTSVAHPQANGQVELTNRVLLHGLKARLEGAQRSWVDELPSVVWGCRTTPNASTGETPFSLTFGCEAVIPSEIDAATFRVQLYEEEANNQNQLLALDRLEESRDMAAIRQARYKQQIKKYHDARVKSRRLQVGDLVLRRNEANRALKEGKLAPNWEGPYRVTRTLGAGSYLLSDMNGRDIPRPWNIDNLKRFLP